MTERTESRSMPTILAVRLLAECQGAAGFGTLSGQRFVGQF